MKKKFILLSLMLAAVFTASAATKTIGGAGADYPSLYAASVDLYAHPITENTEWIIAADLTEILNAGIVNNTEYTLTIRPDAANRVISYTTASDNYGPSGNFVIGGIPVSGLTEQTGNGSNIKWVAAPSQNIIIDGSHDGTDSRDLTITSATVGGRVVVLYGNVGNVTIKNLKVLCTRAGGGYTLHLRTEQLAGSSGMSDPANKTNNSPHEVLIENCEFRTTSTTSSNTQLVALDATNRLSDVGLIENVSVKNCEIEGNHRGVWIGGATNVDVENCTIRMHNPGTGMASAGIDGTKVSGVVNVKNCKILELTTKNTNAGAYGMVGITASGGATVWNIENNIITGMDALASGATSKAFRLCGIRCGDSCIVRHNTIVMPTLTYAPANDLVATNAVAALWLAGTRHYTVENNIFVSHEKTANNSLIRTAAPMENVKHNVFYYDDDTPGNAYVTGSAASCKDMAAYNTTYPAAASKWKAVTFDSDMNLASPSTTDLDLAVLRLADVTKDINGADRGNPTYAGAEDPGTLPVTATELYEMGNNTGWHANAGAPMEMIAPNVFQGSFEMEANSYFAFFTGLALVDDNDGWDYINNNTRYAGDADNKVVAVGDNADLVKANRSFKVEAAGYYTFTVDFNTNKVAVTGYVPAKIELLGDFTTWGTNPILMENETGDLTCKAIVALQPGEHAYRVRINDNPVWKGNTGTMDRTNSTDWTMAADNNCGLLIDVPGNYIFTYTYATGMMTVTYPESFTRTAAVDEYQTLCVPFTADVTGADVYEISAIGDGYVSLNSRSASGLTAGTSYILKATATTITVAKADAGTSVAAPVLPYEGATGLYGVLGASYLYKYDTETSWRSNYVLQSDNKFHEVQAGGEVLIGSTRAYLHIAGGVTAPELRIIEINNGATNINNVADQEQAVKFIQNGQMFIKKNGVVYDMMGHVVR